jgi:hypothetical protein
MMADAIVAWIESIDPDFFRGRLSKPPPIAGYVSGDWGRGIM